MDMGRQKTPSICWDCINPCRKGCSWAEDFTPVEGWEAEHVVDEEKGVDTYRVIRCPEFVQETYETRNRDLDTEGCLRLIEKLMQVTRDDYIHDDKMRKEIERFIRGRGASRLHHIANPDEVIRMLKRDALEHKKKKARLALIKG